MADLEPRDLDDEAEEEKCVAVEASVLVDDEAEEQGLVSVQLRVEKPYFERVGGKSERLSICTRYHTTKVDRSLLGEEMTHRLW